MHSSHHHVFSLSTELLDSLTPRTLVNRLPSREPTPEPAASSTKSGPRACNVCKGVVFLNVDDQRAHFRSDWHRYNVKARLADKQTVAEAAFSTLLEGLEDSLSGSASSDDDEDEDDSDAVETLLNKTKRLATRSPSPGSNTKQPPLSALTWFHSPPSTQIGIYRALLPLRTEPRHYLDELKKLQDPIPSGRKWAMFMVAGGHFAGAVVRVSSAEDDEETQPGRKQKQKRPKPETEVILHKTFHRYTTRRKQGGSQSANDNAKGAAKSAGAQLRRYGEQALRDDIRGLLQDWADEIADCERIWIRASTSNKRIFYDYEGAIWTKDDDRLRGFPFPTRRPTQSELTRCLLELTRPKISHFTEDELRAQDEAYLASLPKARPIPQPPLEPVRKKAPEAPKLSKEEEILREKWTRLLDMLSKNRVDALKSFLDREGPALGGVNATIPEWAGERTASLLQLAVTHGHEEAVRWLLEDASADPTLPVPSPRTRADEAAVAHDSDVEAPTKHSHRTAYDLAKSKAIRDIFRRAAAANPDRWDWFGAAHVPSALTQSMEEEREEKKKVKRKGLKDRVREREARDRDKERSASPEPLPEPVRTNPTTSLSNRLGGSAGASQGLAGLSAEMKARVERERRARAAELRLSALNRG